VVVGVGRVNRDETPYDHLADAVVREPIGDALPRILTTLRENGPTPAGAR
jgi:NAD-dependent deacetylase